MARNHKYVVLDDEGSQAWFYKLEDAKKTALRFAKQSFNGTAYIAEIKFVTEYDTPTIRAVG